MVNVSSVGKLGYVICRSFRPVHQASGDWRPANFQVSTGAGKVQCVVLFGVEVLASGQRFGRYVIAMLLSGQLR